MHQRSVLALAIGLLLLSRAVAGSDAGVISQPNGRYLSIADSETPKTSLEKVEDLVTQFRDRFKAERGAIRPYWSTGSAIEVTRSADLVFLSGAVNWRLADGTSQRGKENERYFNDVILIDSDGEPHLLNLGSRLHGQWAKSRLSNGRTIVARSLHDGKYLVHHLDSSSQTVRADWAAAGPGAWVFTVEDSKPFFRELGANSPPVPIEGSPQINDEPTTVNGAISASFVWHIDREGRNFLLFDTGCCALVDPATRTASWIHGESDAAVYYVQDADEDGHFFARGDDVSGIALFAYNPADMSYRAEVVHRFPEDVPTSAMPVPRVGVVPTWTAASTRHRKSWGEWRSKVLAWRIESTEPDRTYSHSIIDTETGLLAGVVAPREKRFPRTRIDESRLSPHSDK